MSMTLPAAITALVVTFMSRNPGAGPELEKRATAAAEAAYKVASEENGGATPRFLGTDNVARASLLVTWSYYESAWNSCAVGDAGNSLGIMQVNKMWLGNKPKRVICDPEEGFRASLKVLDYLTKECGSEKNALYAYASGRCKKPGSKVYRLVHRRIDESGVVLDKAAYKAFSLD